MAKKLEEYSRGRSDGLLLALKIVKEKGVEALEEEIKFRNVTKINTTMAKHELAEASQAIKAMMLDTVLAMSLLTLRDQFGFGTERLNRFKNRFCLKTECLNDKLLTWEDVTETLKEEVKIDVKIRYND